MSGQQVIDAAGLPDSPLGAGAEFHAKIVPLARAALSEGLDIVIVFAPADHSHEAWRLAAVQGLAREGAPARVNAIAGEADADVVRYLANAPGVTGQLLHVDGNLRANA